MTTFLGQSEIESNLYKPISRGGHISEFRIWKYMKDVQDDNTFSRLTKLNHVTTYDITELDSLVHKHEVNFWTISDTKQWIVIIASGILCGVIDLVTCTIKIQWYKRLEFTFHLAKEYHVRR